MVLVLMRTLSWEDQRQAYIRQPSHGVQQDRSRLNSRSDVAVAALGENSGVLSEMYHAAEDTQRGSDLKPSASFCFLSNLRVMFRDRPLYGKFCFVNSMRLVLILDFREPSCRIIP